MHPLLTLAPPFGSSTTQAHAFQMERLRAQELEASLDRLCVATSIKAADTERQRQQFKEAQQALPALQLAHEEVVALREQLLERVTELDRELLAERRLASGLRQGVADKEQQLTMLVAEVERLQGRPVPLAGSGGSSLVGHSPAALITAHLVTFSSLAELVDKNSQLLAVARSLADELDASRQGVEARVAMARSEEAVEARRRISELAQTCKALEAEAQAADAELRNKRGKGAAAGELEASRSRVAELEEMVAQLHREKAQGGTIQQQQLAAAQSAAATARGDASDARAQQQVEAAKAAALQQQLSEAHARAERISRQLSESQQLAQQLEGEVEQASYQQYNELGSGVLGGRVCDYDVYVPQRNQQQKTGLT